MLLYNLVIRFISLTVVGESIRTFIERKFLPIYRLYRTKLSGISLTSQRDTTIVTTIVEFETNVKMYIKVAKRLLRLN